MYVLVRSLLENMRVTSIIELYAVTTFLCFNVMANVSSSYVFDSLSLVRDKCLSSAFITPSRSVLYIHESTSLMICFVRNVLLGMFLGMYIQPPMG